MEALFCLHLLRKGQADTMGIAMRKALLGEIEGRVSKSEKNPTFRLYHSWYSRIRTWKTNEFTRNCIDWEVINLSVWNSWCVYLCQGSWLWLDGCVTAPDIILPPSFCGNRLIIHTQHIANLTQPIHLCIEWKIERNRAYTNAKEFARRKLSYRRYRRYIHACSKYES